MIEHRLRDDIKVLENQFGFISGRSTMEAIHSLRNSMEKSKEKKENLYLVFINLKKAYNKALRKIFREF